MGDHRNQRSTSTMPSTHTTALTSPIAKPEPPSVADMLGGAASFAGGFVAAILPFILLSVPALILVAVPLVVAAIPLALLGAFLAPPILLVRAVRHRRLERPV